MSPCILTRALTSQTVETVWKEIRAKKKPRSQENKLGVEKGTEVEVVENRKNILTHIP